MGDQLHIRSAVLVCVAALFGAIAAAPAVAKPPPKGKYSCTIGGYYADKVIIKSATRYKRFGKTGKYVAGEKKRSFGSYRPYKGYAITFKTGPFKGFKGNWHKSAYGNEIALKNPSDGYEDTYCDD